MTIFINCAVPASFMVKVGWAFMGITAFNIATNMVILSVTKIYSAITSHLEKKNEKKILGIYNKRLDNLKLI
jgi:hypothetical protein